MGQLHFTFNVPCTCLMKARDVTLLLLYDSIPVLTFHEN